MSFFRLCFFLLVGALSLCVAPPTFAQSAENVTTVEGPRGEEMTLTAQPHGLADGLSARAMCISAPDTTRWALSLIGATEEDEISLTYGDESMPIEGIDRPEDGVGPTKVYVSKENFLTMAETATVTLRVGTVSVSLPEALRHEMRVIFDRS